MNRENNKPNKEWLVDQIKQNTTIKTIASKTNLSERYIYSLLKKYHINSRQLRLDGKLEKSKQEALILGLTMLSTKFLGAHTKHLYKCNCGEIFESTPNYIRQGQGCIKCGHINSGLKRRVSYKRILRLITSKDGTLIKTEYVKHQLYLTVQCNKDNYIWRNPWGHFQQGRWCPKCSFDSMYLHESNFRLSIEKLTGKEFKSIRPPWLENPITGYNLELDGYNEELRIGFEYQGRQHFEYTPFFHASEKEFEEQLTRDFIKKTLCKDLNIKVLYPTFSLKEAEYEKFIRDNLSRRLLR